MALTQPRRFEGQASRVSHHGQKKRISTNRPDILTQTFFIHKTFPCSRTANPTFEKLRFSGFIALPVGPTPTFENSGAWIRIQSLREEAVDDIRPNRVSRNAEAWKCGLAIMHSFENPREAYFDESSINPDVSPAVPARATDSVGINCNGRR